MTSLRTGGSPDWRRRSRGSWKRSRRRRTTADTRTRPVSASVSALRAPAAGWTGRLGGTARTSRVPTTRGCAPACCGCSGGGCSDCCSSWWACTAIRCPLRRDRRRGLQSCPNRADCCRPVRWRRPRCTASAAWRQTTQWSASRLVAVAARWPATKAGALVVAAADRTGRHWVWTWVGSAARPVSDRQPTPATRPASRRPRRRPPAAPHPQLAFGPPFSTLPSSSWSSFHFSLSSPSPTIKSVSRHFPLLVQYPRNQLPQLKKLSF